MVPAALKTALLTGFLLAGCHLHQPSQLAQESSSEAAVAAPEFTDFELRVVERVNQLRATKGLPALLPSRPLMEAAKRRAIDNEREGRHHNLNKLRQYSRQYGFTGSVTENEGYDPQRRASVQVMVDHWWHPVSASNGHGMQMQGYMKINRQWSQMHWNRVGIGRSGRTWMLVLGREQVSPE